MGEMVGNVRVYEPTGFAPAVTGKSMAPRPVRSSSSGHAVASAGDGAMAAAALHRYLETSGG